MKQITNYPKAVVTYLSEVRTELTKVTWPKRHEVIKLTAIILLICLIVGSFVGGVDFGLTKLIEYIVKK